MNVDGILVSGGVFRDRQRSEIVVEKGTNGYYSALSGILFGTGQAG
jgi:hypothetical protein